MGKDAAKDHISRCAGLRRRRFTATPRAPLSMQRSEMGRGTVRGRSLSRRRRALLRKPLAVPLPAVRGEDALTLRPTT
jgi:hypothetical protein